MRANHSPKDQIIALLKGIETGDPLSVTVVDEDQYIQHNPQTHEGSLGLAELFKQLSKTSPRVNIVRILKDGDFVFAHTEYDFAQRNIGFEIFRFVNDKAVEHWDNIQKRQGPNKSGHSMVDGEVNVINLELTETHRVKVQNFIHDVLIRRDRNVLSNYLDSEHYVEHSPDHTDEETKFSVMLTDEADKPELVYRYQTCHRILAEGDFVLSVCEGYRAGSHTSFFDLFRLNQGKIVEHWDTMEAIPHKSEWKNDNGKF